MKKKFLSYILLLVAIGVFIAVTVLSLRFAFSITKAADETTVMTAADKVAEQAKQYNYRIWRSDCNAYLTVDGRRTGDEYVNVRSQPDMSNNYKVGRVADGTQIVADRLYLYGDTNNDFVGIPAESLKGILDIEDDSDGIVWMSYYYLKVQVFPYPETYEDDPNRPYRTTDFTKVEIVGNENPNLRATPYTADVGNVYGKLPVGTVIEVSGEAKLLLNDTNTFVGIPLVAGSLESVMEEVGYGHIYYDQDYVLWVSLDYAKLS